MSRVVEINCIEHLQTYRLAWSALWRRTRRASFTQSLDWFDTAFRCDSQALRPRVLIVQDDNDEPVGILPLVVREESTNLGPMRVLGYPLAPFAALCGPVGSLPTVTLIEGLRHVARSPRDWDVLDLRGIEAAYVDGRRTTAALGIAGFPAEVEPWQDRGLVEFGDVWADFWRTRDAVGLDRFEHQRRQLERRGEVTHVRYRPAGTMHADDDPRWDLYADCLTIARGNRRETTLDESTPAAPAWAEFFRQAHLAAVHAGALDLNLLYVDDVPAAYAYNYVVDDFVACASSGTAASPAADDAGAVLTYQMLRQSHAWGDRAIDFGPANDEWTRFWSTRRATSLRAVHYPASSWKTQLLRWGRTLRRALQAG